MSTPLLTTRDLCKSYGGVQALRGADLDVFPGEVHALLGENGTGKSTLMRILAGVETADGGVLIFDGRTTSFRTAAQAREAGVSIVFQELSLFGDLDVLANLFAGREPRRGGRVDRRAMRREAAPVLERLGLTFALDAPVSSLTLAERQMVEIAKALLGRARLLILDEPNSALDATESTRLFSLIRELRDDGTALVYISHRLEEVFALADRISVMRGGRVVRTDRTQDLDIPTVVETMLGRPAVATAPAEGSAALDTAVAVRVEHLDVHGRLDDVSLHARTGEVVGLVGLEGAGQQDVLRVLFGDLAPSGGRMELSGSPWQPRTPRQAVRAGVALVPADRARAGLMMARSIADNVAAVRMAIGTERMVRRRDLQRRAARQVDELGVRTASTHLPADSLSGGNQQKVVLAKWLEVGPRLLLLDDPTRGVDVGGKAEIYELVTALARSGVTVLFTSTEFLEYQAVCHRVLVFADGRTTAELDGAAASEHLLAELVNTGRSHPRPSAAPPAPDRHDDVSTGRPQGASL